MLGRSLENYAIFTVGRKFKRVIRNEQEKLSDLKYIFPSSFVPCCEDKGSMSKLNFHSSFSRVKMRDKFISNLWDHDMKYFES